MSIRLQQGSSIPLLGTEHCTRTKYCGRLSKKCLISGYPKCPKRYFLTWAESGSIGTHLGHIPFSCFELGPLVVPDICSLGFVVASKPELRRGHHRDSLKPNPAASNSPKQDT